MILLFCIFVGAFLDDITLYLHHQRAPQLAGDCCLLKPHSNNLHLMPSNCLLLRSYLLELLIHLTAKMIRVMLTYRTLLYLGLNTFHNFLNTTPQVFILSSAPNHTERLKNVYDIVNAPSFNSKLTSA